MSLIKKLEEDFKASVPPEARTSSSSDSSGRPQPRNGVSHYLSVHQRNRLFHYFSTGTDPRKAFPPMDIPGLDWRRTIESLAATVANKLFALKSSSSIIKVVLIPTGPNFGGVLALTLSRYLCDLGAAVFIIVDVNSMPTEDTQKKESRLASMYREEIRLLKDIYMPDTGIMLGAKYDIDMVVWGHGFDVVNASSEFMISAERWLALQAESVETRVDLVNLPSNLNTTFVAKRARHNVIFDIGFPVIFNDARATSAKRFVARLPTGERQLHNLIQKQGFEPAGDELHFNCESQVYQISNN
ncbi:hypothetical protein Ciccas_009946 [Cichlidogyrus casuarinus]|uniref:Uncharacterized protein n=1 Tax=Cichlidogyrus casuarinus TaxID=1844966 RepID=A0ABD2PXF3_9PLAT